MNKCKPIMFHADDVRAILNGRKTQTRRVIKLQPPEESHICFDSIDPYQGEGFFFQYPKNVSAGITFNKQFMLPQGGQCPYGKPGDLLWVRERHYYDVQLTEDRWNIVYDIPSKMTHWSNYKNDTNPKLNNWRPPVHMPRWASRITLKVNDIRVERVQDISIDDCLAEGINQFRTDCSEDVCWDVPAYWRNPEGRIIKRIQCDGIIEAFGNVWDSQNAKRGYSWESNP